MFAIKVSSLIKSWTSLSFGFDGIVTVCGQVANIQLEFNLMELLCQEEPNSLIET